LASLDRGESILIEEDNLTAAHPVVFLKQPQGLTRNLACRRAAAGFNFTGDKFVEFRVSETFMETFS
jgi:hypothetical protein